MYQYELNLSLFFIYVLPAWYILRTHRKSFEKDEDERNDTEVSNNKRSVISLSRQTTTDDMLKLTESENIAIASQSTAQSNNDLRRKRTTNYQKSHPRQVENPFDEQEDFDFDEEEDEDSFFDHNGLFSADVMRQARAQGKNSMWMKAGSAARVFGVKESSLDDNTRSSLDMETMNYAAPINEP